MCSIVNSLDFDIIENFIEMGFELKADKIINFNSFY